MPLRHDQMPPSVKTIPSISSLFSHKRGGGKAELLLYKHTKKALFYTLMKRAKRSGAFKKQTLIITLAIYASNQII
jgi:hypothetical protein